jgi:hypothetical protein
MLVWRGSSTPIPHRGSHQRRWLIRLERPPRADRSARGLGTCRPLRAHLQVGTVVEGEWAVRSRARCLAKGW